MTVSTGHPVILPAAPVKKTELPPALWERRKVLMQCIADWTAELEDVNTEISELIGRDGVATVDGRDVLVNRVTVGFAGKEFAKAHAELALQFLTYETKQVLDKERLRKEMPALWEQYRSVSLKPIGSQA